jgi:hypothetical protein
MTNLSDKYRNSLPFESSNVTTIVDNYTVSNNETVFVNSASSALTVTLPLFPTQGSKIKVLDIAANSQNNNITILGNGNNIGGASAYIINTPDSSVEVMYINAIKGWNILNEYVSLTKPGAPTGVSAVDVGTGRAYNNGAATVTFAPSTSGDEATSFTVTSTPGSYTAIGTSSPIVVPGLQSNTSYTFKVFATNAAGNSTESTASSSITATTVPESPTITSISYGFERLSVSYTTGASGGKSISAYSANRTGGVPVSGTSPIELSSLTGGTTYEVTMTATNANGISAPSAAQSQTPFTASGGNITTSGGYRIHTFNGSTNFVLTGNSISTDFLVIGGGGSGGGGTTSRGGKGGGGAGGYRTSLGTSGANSGSESLLNVSPGTYAVTVGGGGTGPTGNANGSSGTNSIFSSITSLGGGFGAVEGTNGGTGGSGGGGGYFIGGGGSGTANQGRNGGSYGGDSGGGGGGASGTGAGGGSPQARGGDGGAGLSNSITGTSITRAGGGGGGGFSSGSNGGSGGGGAGGGGGGGGNGTDNTGSGGGGAGSSHSSGNTKGGNGGSGIVIVRYAI